MKKAKTFALALLAFIPVTALPQSPGIPVAPLAAAGFMGWTNAFRLSNGLVEAVIVPEIGRMIFFGHAGGQNLLRLDESLAGETFPRKSGKEWINFGGQWMWPAAQTVWPSFQTSNWPPSPMMDRKPWTGYAWTETDGSMACAISRNFGQPLNAEARQIYRLMPSNSFITIRQSLVRTAPSAVPVTLWNIVQVPLPGRIAFAAPAGTSDSPGWQTLMFNEPPPGSMQRCGEFMLYTPGADDETKLGSRAPAAHAAAFTRAGAVVLKALPNGDGAGPSANTISTEVYVNAGLGYAELETLSAEKNLQADEVLSFTVQVHAMEIEEAEADPCLEVRTIKERIP